MTGLRRGVPVTKAEVYLVRARHPSWWPRLFKGWVRREWLWRAQGCPRDIPVVTRPGRLIAYPDGRGKIDGWHFDFGKMRRSSAVTLDELWDQLSAHYPVEREAVSPR